MLTQSEKYRSYVLCGHAILQQEGIQHAERYAASGPITWNTKVVEACSVPGAFDTEAEAELDGLAWARAWVDNRGYPT
jgi:hypothetical protein